MMLEPTKGAYDDECARVLKDTHAHTVILVVIAGDRGHGCTMATTDRKMEAIAPELFRKMADLVEQRNKSN
jgi:hypothetical protein